MTQFVEVMVLQRFGFASFGLLADIVVGADDNSDGNSAIVKRNVPSMDGS